MEQPLRMARHSWTKIFGTGVKDCLTQCVQEEVEYGINSGCKSLRMKKIFTHTISVSYYSS